jgi:hypothetical protein
VLLLQQSYGSKIPLRYLWKNSVQVNAFPPSPKATVDLYVSSNHGESDTTITLRFPTYKTRNNVTPDVRVELVVG